MSFFSKGRNWIPKAFLLPLSEQYAGVREMVLISILRLTEPLGKQMSLQKCGLCWRGVPTVHSGVWQLNFLDCCLYWAVWGSCTGPGAMQSHPVPQGKLLYRCVTVNEEKETKAGTSEQDWGRREEWPACRESGMYGDEGWQTWEICEAMWRSHHWWDSTNLVSRSTFWLHALK